MAGRTPGDWAVRTDKDGDEIWLGGQGCGTFTIYPTNSPELVIAYLGGHGFKDPETLANIRLILAAPNLLAIAEDLSEWFKKVDVEGGDDYLNGNGWADLDAIVQRARAAGRAIQAPAKPEPEDGA